jgi:hypothetical protein
MRAFIRPVEGRDMPSVPRARSTKRQAFRIANRLTPTSLARSLSDALTGPTHKRAAEVIWEDRGSQILLYVGKLQVRLADGVLVVAVDVETTESGRTTLIVRYVFGSATGAAGLVASSDAVVHGDPLVAARWGSLLRDVIWAAIVRLSEAHATERGRQPQSIAIRRGQLEFAARAPASLRALAADHLARQKQRYAK